MSDRKADAPLSVEIPSRDDDRPAWGKVGAITAIGFVVGVAWPHVAGVRVGPSLPADALMPASSASAAGATAERYRRGPEPRRHRRARPDAGVPARVRVRSRSGGGRASVRLGGSRRDLLVPYLLR